MVLFSLSIPFEKSILGISFGFTILLKIYWIICIVISVVGIKNMMKLRIKITMLFIFELIIVANIADSITDNTNIDDIYIFVFVFSSICFLVLYSNFS